MKNIQNLENRMNTAFESMRGGYLAYKKLVLQSKVNIFYNKLVLLAIVAFFCAKKLSLHVVGRIPEVRLPQGGAFLYCKGSVK